MSFNGLTSTQVATWLALNPNNQEVAEALAMAFAPIITDKGTAAFDTGMEVTDAEQFMKDCADVDMSEDFY